MDRRLKFLHPSNKHELTFSHATKGTCTSHDQLRSRSTPLAMLINRVARCGVRTEPSKTQHEACNDSTSSKATAAITLKQTRAGSTECHLLRLPAELRNTIFSLVVEQHPDQSTVMRVRTVHANSRRHSPTPDQPALSRTARQIRHEVLSMFYGQRTFTIRARRLVRDRLLETWSLVMRPSLFYLRSLKFKLRCPDTAMVVNITVRLTDSGALECEFDHQRCNLCVCKFSRCARDVERGIIGSKADAPLIRFLKAWELPPPPDQYCDRYADCGFCGQQIFHVSLRSGGLVSERASAESGSESEFSSSSSV